MTKPLITLPCTARELEAALHKVCDHGGLWDAKVYEAYGRIFLVTNKSETKGEK